jgi:DNA mismatch repair ATPase MutS
MVVQPMLFHSILFDLSEIDVDVDVKRTPSFFHDLNLDQIFQSLTAGRQEYDLAPFFSVPLNDVEAITYRHEILRDLDEQELREHIKSFAWNMIAMRRHLAQADELRYEYQKASWFLDAVEIYCEAVNCLADQISRLDVKSRGFRAFREYLKTLVDSDGFRSLLSETKTMKHELYGVTYCVHIQGSTVTVNGYKGEPDYGAEVEETFRKFQQRKVKDYGVAFPEPADMNHVEVGILDLVAQLYPDIFLALRDYYNRHHDYLDPTIRRFNREVQFYLAYLEFIKNLKSAGLNFCYPQVTDRSKEVHAYETFDLALANKLIHEHSRVVSNDFYLKDPERIFVVSGPNQSGKTTFARTFGQLHYLARLGYPVPGREAQLFLCDRMFTHFEKEEHIENLRGKLQDELIRIHEILQQATSNSIVIMNECLASTTLRDALLLGREVLQQIIQRDMLCVVVTFIDEFSTLSETTVSMVGTVVPENPVLRTYKIVRRPADGRAYAIAIAKKYGLTYESLKRRIMR